jgi:hypothetical protein
MTNIYKYLACAFVRSIKCNRTRIIDMKSLRNLFHLVHRANMVDSSQIKREKEMNDACFSLILVFTIITLIVYKEWCVCERDPLPWQDAVTRSVVANEAAIKCTCSHFRRQSSYSCVRIWSWHRIQKKKRRKEKLRIGLYFRHKKEERINFYSIV